MKKGNGKQKGSKFERTISKFLTKWVNPEEESYIFYRSPSSGALFTVSNLNEASGDIVAVKDEGKFFTDKFSIECKCGYSDVDFFQLFKNLKNFKLNEFWNQCSLDAKKSNKYPMLIYNKKNNKTIVGINSIVYTKLKKYLPINKIVITLDNDTDIYFFNIDDFFEKIQPKHIKGLK